MGNWQGKTLVAGLCAGLLAACSSWPSGGFGSSASVNYASGSSLGAQLAPRDREALAAAFLPAMETGAQGTPHPWSGGRARGVVIPGESMLANLKSNPNIRMPARAGLDLTHRLETELGLYVTIRNANVRTGPSTERRIAEQLSAGAGVDVVGKITGQPWMLVAVDGRIRGYVHASLLVKAPGTELELAGGPRRKPVLCRAFTQRISAYGQSDEWQGAACAYGQGWRLAPPAPAEREDDDGLLEF